MLNAQIPKLKTLLLKQVHQSRTLNKANFQPPSNKFPPKTRAP